MKDAFDGLISRLDRAKGEKKPLNLSVSKLKSLKLKSPQKKGRKKNYIQELWNN